MEEKPLIGGQELKFRVRLNQGNSTPILKGAKRSLNFTKYVVWAIKSF